MTGSRSVDSPLLKRRREGTDSPQGTDSPTSSFYSDDSTSSAGFLTKEREEPDSKCVYIYVCLDVTHFCICSIRKLGI